MSGAAALERCRRPSALWLPSSLAPSLTSSLIRHRSGDDVDLLEAKNVGGQLVRVASSSNVGLFCAANLAAVVYVAVGLATKALFLGGGLTATEHSKLEDVRFVAPHVGKALLVAMAVALQLLAIVAVRIPVAGTITHCRSASASARLPAAPAALRRAQSAVPRVRRVRRPNAGELL